MQDIIDLYTLRIPLEGFAARLVIEKESVEPGLARIRRAYGKLVQIGKEGDPTNYLAADFEFHRTIWEASGNSKLARVLNETCVPLFGFSLIQVVGRGKSFSTERAAFEHQPIVEALEKQEPDLVEKVVREAIIWNREEYVRRCWKPS